MAVGNSLPYRLSFFPEKDSVVVNMKDIRHIEVTPSNIVTSIPSITVFMLTIKETDKKAK
jgi:hypothetical protein